MWRLKTHVLPKKKKKNTTMKVFRGTGSGEASQHCLYVEEEIRVKMAGVIFVVSYPFRL